MTHNTPKYRQLDDENHVFESQNGGVNIPKKAVDEYQNKVNAVFQNWENDSEKKVLTMKDIETLNKRVNEIKQRLSEISDIEKKNRENFYLDIKVDENFLVDDNNRFSHMDGDKTYSWESYGDMMRDISDIRRKWEIDIEKQKLRDRIMAETQFLSDELIKEREVLTQELEEIKKLMLPLFKEFGYI